MQLKEGRLQKLISGEFSIPYSP